MAPMKFHRVLPHENFHPATLQGGISTQMFFTACLTGGGSGRKITAFLQLFLSVQQSLHSAHRNAKQQPHHLLLTN